MVAWKFLAAVSIGTSTKRISYSFRTQIPAREKLPSGLGLSFATMAENKMLWVNVAAVKINGHEVLVMTFTAKRPKRTKKSATHN